MSSYLFVSYSSNILYSVFNERIYLYNNFYIPYRSWWAQVDSNHRPRAYQARALTPWAMSPWCFSVHLVYSLTLPFRRLCRLVEMKGIEPLTPCLQGRGSPSWATPPFFNEVLSFLSVTQNWTTMKDCTRTLCACTFSRRLFLVLVYYEYEQSATPLLLLMFSIERRWSSRTFRYGYLVTT